MALTIGPRLQAFFGEVLPAIVTTLNERGQPEMTPVWYEYADGCIWFNGDKSRKWLGRMERSGRATFFLLDPKNAWRWAQVWGRVLEVSDDPGGQHIDRLAQRYRGTRYGAAGRDTRRKAKVAITAVKGADGSPRERWDVTR